MTDDEIVYLIHAHYATSGEIFDVIIFARAIEHCTLTKQKARWYQEGLEAGNTQSQELYGKTEQLEAEIKRLQEKQMILNKAGCAECGKGSGYALYCVACHDQFNVWVELTDEDIEELRCHGAHSVSDTDFRAIEAKLKEKNT